MPLSVTGNTQSAAISFHLCRPKLLLKWVTTALAHCGLGYLKALNSFVRCAFVIINS